MSGVEFGVVKLFSSRSKFGFVSVLDARGNPTGEELHFHYNSGHSLREGSHEPEFHKRTGRKVDGVVKKLNLPLPGDKVVFSRGHGENGLKVMKWSYASDYDALVRVIAGR